ncbi:glutamine amidotransferase [Microbacterium neimengense]
MARVLLAGESWFVHEIHQKGFDTFTASRYEEGGGEFVAALTGAGHEVTRIPSHLIADEFPENASSIHERWDVVVLSDVGANTFLLPPSTFRESRVAADRLAALRDFVRDGGGLAAIGGYLSFSGIDAKARWGRSAIADILPVRVLSRDDRVEVPQSIAPVVSGDHPVTAGLESVWPGLLGYNEVAMREGARLLASIGDDPLLVVTEAGRGRAAAFTSDLAPHWCPPEFLAWAGYARLFDRLISWLAREELA